MDDFVEDILYAPPLPPAQPDTPDEDILIAQKQDELAWLIEVDQEVSEIAVAVEMMEVDYQELRQWQQTLADRRMASQPQALQMAACVGEKAFYFKLLEDAVPLRIKSGRIIDITGDNYKVLDENGKQVLVAKGRLATGQAEDIRRKRKRRPAPRPLERVKETEPSSIFDEIKVPKPSKPKKLEPEKKSPLVPMKPAPRQDVPSGKVPVDTPPDQVPAEPIAEPVEKPPQVQLQPMDQPKSQPLQPVIAPIQLVQKTPPPPPKVPLQPIPAPEELETVDFSDIPEDEWKSLTNAEKIRMGAVFRRIIIIEYEKITAPETGVVKSYQLEPYSYRVKRPKRANGANVWYLFAHDIVDNHIKAFIVRNIIDVEIIDQEFSARWDVEFEYNPRWDKHKKKPQSPAGRSEVDYVTDIIPL
jgi:hypothetical protein